MKIAPILLALVALAGPANAEECVRSVERILDGSREISLRPQAYRALLTVCLETAQMSNVQNALVLASGSIGIVPREDGVMATASTLSQFCRRFPKEQVQFITSTPRATGGAGQTPAPTSCAKILGHR